MILLYFQHHFLQTVFFEKIDASQLTDQLAEFVSQLQRIGVTLQAYNGAYNNTGHPSAADAQAQFVQNCGPPPSKKKRLLMDIKVMRQHQHQQVNNEHY